MSMGAEGTKEVTLRRADAINSRKTGVFCRERGQSRFFSLMRRNEGEGRDWEKMMVD